MSKKLKIALAGNPNSGKSSLFNALTGLNQKVGNFPGVTVDKKIGFANITSGIQSEIIDLPGTYSLYPKGADEYVTYETLINPSGIDNPDIIVVVVDASNLKRNLLFCSQIMDLKKPTLMVLTMMDIVKKNGVQIDIDGLSRSLGIPVVEVNPRKSKGVTALKKALELMMQHHRNEASDFVPVLDKAPDLIQEVKSISKVTSNYAALHIACASEELTFINKDQKDAIDQALVKYKFTKSKIQAEEVMMRYDRIGQIMKSNVVEDSPIKKQILTDKIDKILLHKVWGNIILFVVLLFLFQCIYWLASYPMDWIDGGFGMLKEWLSTILPVAWWSDLFINGIVSGIGGIVIFVPQIAILFGLITLLEDSGYMARISFLSDRLMRSVGLNGRAVMPLISGMACSIPAVMAARVIEDKKERLMTILITPLMSCSARLPVYTIMIALVIPSTNIFGIFNLRGLVLMGLYLLGFVVALIVSKILSIVMKQKSKTIFLMELPLYRAPRWKNALTTMLEKSKIFVKDAGKIILIISIVLWGLATYGPTDRIEKIEQSYELLSKSQPEGLTETQLEEKAHLHLENSYAGILGKTIEPFIIPLGYDWKIGIGLISSFAAREAFVGTMGTLYSVGEVGDDVTKLQSKMAAATHPDGTKVYTLASGVSLMVFYVFAMQCMSTLAIVKRETKTWKWPVIQTIYMTAIAYLFAFISFQLLK